MPDKNSKKDVPGIGMKKFKIKLDGNWKTDWYLLFHEFDLTKTHKKTKKHA